jgi:hypothetical protein
MVRSGVRAVSARNARQLGLAKARGGGKMARFLLSSRNHEGFPVTERALSGRERRSHRRRPLRAPMWLVAGGSRIPVSALDVSVGGVAVHARAEAEVGAVVELEAELGDARRFALEAEIVRAERGVLGLRFLALGQRELEALLAASGHSASTELSGPESGV